MADIKTHWERFLEFSQLELAAGGPDPHLDLAICGMAETPDPLEKTWRAGCYVAPYEVGTGFVLWEHWSRQAVLDHPEGLKLWIKDHWAGLRFRKERRAVRTPQKLTECLVSIAHWSEHVVQYKHTDFSTLWGAALQIRYFGRYAALKFVETLRRGGVVQTSVPDIRPQGGWSPRLTLSWFYPEYPPREVVYNNGTSAVVWINEVTQKVLEALSRHVGTAVLPFALEVLLCNYRQALEWRYPGHSHDATLSHYHHLKSYWGETCGTSLLA